MPLIHVQLIEDVFTPAQKKEIIAKLTDAMVSIEGENMRPFVWVVLEEVKSGDWAMGGRAMTTDAVRALSGGSRLELRRARRRPRRVGRTAARGSRARGG